MLLTHGTADFARTFDRLAPVVAAGGWRVIAWDQRGHGDSARADLYSWGADLRDLLAVMDHIGQEPIPLVGHSKGGMLVTMLADARPHRVSHLVNIDGFSTRLEWWVESDHVSSEFGAARAIAWLDRSRSGPVVRRGRPRAELVEKRHRRNPRLDREWLEHLVDVGARSGVDGWTWKLDPMLDPSVFQVLRQEWPLLGMPGLPMPLLVVLGLVQEELPMNQTAASLSPYLSPGATLVAYRDSGHFVHVEHPVRLARLLLDFLGDPAVRPVTETAVPAAQTR